MSSPTEVEQQPADVSAADAPPEPPSPRREKKRSWIRQHPVALIVILLFLALAIGIGIRVWEYYSIRESTDDARIDAHIAPVSARVGGSIIEILVDENQTVKVGQVLARIDDKDYRVALRRAEADLAAQTATARAAQTQIPIATTSSTTGISGAQAAQLEAEAGVTAAAEAIRNAQARVVAAEADQRAAVANRDRAAADLTRYRQLVEKDEISRQQYDTAIAASRSGQAQVDAAQAAITQAKAAVRAAESERRQALARLAQARSNVAAAESGPKQVAVSKEQARSQEAVAGVRKAAVDQARLNLEYTVIRAPVAGIIGRRTAQLGQNVITGQPLFSIVEVANVWVSALFKETQLKPMRPGQKVIVEVDALRGAELQAHIESMGAATGGTFSVLPAENASGNFVKVVQRLPMKIVFEPNQPDVARLRPGMSVVPTVLLR